MLAAAALKCMGGEIQGRLFARDEEERAAALAAGYDLDAVLTTDDLVQGDNCFFAATGVTDGELLQGVRFHEFGATTQSLVMRSKSGTLRTIHANHALAKLSEFSSVLIRAEPGHAQPELGPAQRLFGLAQRRLGRLRPSAWSAAPPRPEPSSDTRCAADLPGPLGPGHVDLLGQLGDAGQHRDPGREPGQRPVALGQALGRAGAGVDLDEAAVHGQAELRAVGQVDLDQARARRRRPAGCARRARSARLPTSPAPPRWHRRPPGTARA